MENSGENNGQKAQLRWVCRFGHVTMFSRGYELGDYRWEPKVDGCESCRVGPNLVEFMRLSVAALNDKLERGRIEPDEFHALANEVASFHDREHRYDEWLKGNRTKYQSEMFDLMLAAQRVRGRTRYFRERLDEDAPEGLVSWLGEVAKSADVLRFYVKMAASTSGLEWDVSHLAGRPEFA